MRGCGVIFHGDGMSSRKNFRPFHIDVDLPRIVMLNLLEIAKSSGKSVNVMLKNVIREYAKANSPGKHYGGDRSTTAAAEVVRRIEITIKESQK